MPYGSTAEFHDTLQKIRKFASEAAISLIEDARLTGQALTEAMIAEGVPEDVASLYGKTVEKRMVALTKPLEDAEELASYLQNDLKNATEIRDQARSRRQAATGGMVIS